MIYLFAALLSVELSVATFPEQFQGDWYAAPGKCDKDQVSLRIGRSTFDSLAEYGAKLDRIVEDHERSIKVGLQFSAEGHQWQGVQVLTLNDARTQLVNEPARPEGKYYRCTPSHGERG